MGAFLSRNRKLHIWLLGVVLFLAGYFLLRGSRSLMNALADYVTTPFKQGMSRLCSFTEVSVAEVLYITLGSVTVFYGANAIRRLVKGLRRGETAYRFILTLLCAGLTFYAGFCLLWGINYHTDSFQDRSGIHAFCFRHIDIKHLCAVDRISVFSKLKSTRSIIRVHINKAKLRILGFIRERINEFNKIILLRDCIRTVCALRQRSSCAECHC